MPNNKYRRAIKHTFFKRRPSAQEILRQEKSAQNVLPTFIQTPALYHGNSKLITFLLFTAIVASLLPPTVAQHPYNGSFNYSPRQNDTLANNNSTLPRGDFPENYSVVSSPQQQLVYAVTVQDLANTKALLSQKITFNHLRIEVENQKLSLLDMALLQKDLVIAKELLEHGAIINPDNVVYIVGHAIAQDDLSFMKALTQLGLDLTEPGLKNTIFPLACAKGRLAFVRYFIEENAIGDIPAKLLDKALLNAAKNHQKEVIHYLQAYQQDQKSQQRRSAFR